MATIDMSKPVDRMRMRLGDWDDVTILPDHVYEYYLTANDNNEKAATVEAAYAILAILTHNTRERLDRLEFYSQQQFDQHLTLIREYIRNPNSSFNTAGIYAGGVDREEFLNNLADPTIINKRIPTYDNMRDPFCGE